MANDDIPSPIPFNPLDKRHLGESVAAAMLKTDIHNLPPEKFKGAGIYAIYYIGDFEAYSELSATNRDGQFAPHVRDAIRPKGISAVHIDHFRDHDFQIHQGRGSIQVGIFQSKEIPRVESKYHRQQDIGKRSLPRLNSLPFLRIHNAR